MKVLVTGSAGFIGGYLVEELLSAGHDVVGLDDFSKYGERKQAVLANSRFTFVRGDAKSGSLLRELLADCDHFIAGAAIIGGVAYFNNRAFDLLAENEQITAAAFRAAIEAHRDANLKKITVLSSSMVYGSATRFPHVEGDELEFPPPKMAYGFQKLAVEYFARAAWDQYGLPYTIVRPFNCVGIGETRALSAREVFSGDIKLALGHVIPDLIQKILRGQDPVHILGDGNQIRHYSHGTDLARGIRLCMEHPEALNEDFNLSSDQQATVLQLAEEIWHRIKGSDEAFRYVSDAPFPNDITVRIPSIDKARTILGFEASKTLDGILDELIPWIQDQLAVGVL